MTAIGCLVFVSDAILPELRRIIEFLNGQMNPAEVYGVEIKQYIGGRLKTLVPRLIGRTADASRAKSAGGVAASPQWTPERFEAELGQRVGVEAVRRARRILDWAVGQRLRVWWGRGAGWGGFVPIYEARDGTRHQLFEVWSVGTLEVYFQHLAAKTPFNDEAPRRELRARLVAIPEIRIPEDAISRRPTFPLLALQDDAAIDRLLDTFDWVLDRTRALQARQSGRTPQNTNLPWCLTGAARRLAPAPRQ